MSVPHQLRRVRLHAKKTSLSPPQEFVTDRSKAMVLLWFSVACFGVKISVMFHLMFVYAYILLVRFWLLSGHLLGNSCALGWSFVLIVFCLFVFFSILVLKASAITMPELVEINLVSDGDNSLTDRK